MRYYKKYNKSGEVFCSSVLEPDTLTSFNDFLNKEFSEIVYVGRCVDNTKIEFNDLNELLGYQNFRKRRLSHLEIECSTDEKSLDITF